MVGSSFRKFLLNHYVTFRRRDEDAIASLRLSSKLSSMLFRPSANFALNLSCNVLLIRTQANHMYTFIYLWLYNPCGSWPRFHFRNLYTFGRNPWTGDQPVSRPLPTHRTTRTQNKRTQASMPRVGFGPKIPAFELAKTVHALDRAATVIGYVNLYD
jgi:hypothetical protein